MTTELLGAVSIDGDGTETVVERARCARKDRIFLSK